MMDVGVVSNFVLKAIFRTEGKARKWEFGSIDKRCAELRFRDEQGSHNIWRRVWLR